MLAERFKRLLPPPEQRSPANRAALHKEGLAGRGPRTVPGKHEGIRGGAARLQAQEAPIGISLVALPEGAAVGEAPALFQSLVVRAPCRRREPP